MTESIQTFDKDAVRRLGRTVRRLETQVRNLSAKVKSLRHTGGDTVGALGQTIRTGKTVQHPSLEQSYPDGGCTFWVRFQDWQYNEQATGHCEYETHDWGTPQVGKFVIAQVYTGAYLPENTEVIMFKIPGRKGRRWWILPRRRIVIAKLTAVLNQGSSAAANVWQRNSADTAWEVSAEPESITVHDWMLGAGESISSGKKVVAELLPSGHWVVISAECE
ncbi:MAG: hypothetical protein ACPGWS_04895 [Solirubrobacterales bacterium]